jgi:putative spermidine/putrescine transport system ATP-binding protein
VASPAGDQLRATPVGAASPGGEAVAAVRPEHVVVHPEQHLRMLEAVLEESIYHGDHTRLRFRTSWGAVITCKVTRPSELGALIPGVPTALGWRSEDCRAFAT